VRDRQIWAGGSPLKEGVDSTPMIEELVRKEGGTGAR
jgi:hypothetical protein